VEQVKRALAGKSSELTLELDDELGQVIYKIVDSATREVIRQIPSKELVALARALANEPSAGGLLQDEI